MSNHVLFTYRPETLPVDESMPNRQELFSKLQNRDLTPVVSLAAEAAFKGGEVSVYDAQILDGVETGKSLGFSEAGIIINRLDRSLRKAEIDQAERLPAMINENETRALAWRKDRTYREVLQPAGMGLPTQLVERPDDVDAFLDSEPGTRIIIKPRNGYLGQGIEVLPRADVAGWFADNPDLIGKRIIQPMYDFTQQFPTGLRPYDKQSTEAFAGWNVAGKVKELRVYGFKSPLGVELFPVARSLDEGDRWLFVDPDSVDAELYRQTEYAITKAATISGAAAMLGTVDYGYGRLDGGESSWHAVEMNGKAPYMPRPDEHAGVANIIQDMFVDQISRTVAESNGHAANPVL